MALRRPTLVLLALLAAACSKKGAPSPPTVGSGTTSSAAPAPGSNLTAFASEAEMKKLFDDLAEEQRKKAQERRSKSGGASPPAPSVAASPAADSLADTKSAAKEEGESITNNQHAGVDEGGIVKTHGDHLVILRRGRLFTVKVGGDALTPIAAVDAFGPDIDPRGTWYDEMLVSGDTAIVVGYSYARGGTEIGLFDLGRDGNIRYRATYHLRSNDYYSSRNYASRVIGDKLVFYTPSYLALGSQDPMRAFPAVRRWHKDAADAEFKRVIEPTRIYRPVTGFATQALHTVTICDLAKPEMACTGTGVLGPAGRTFYVSQDAVYVWATDWRYDQGKSSSKSMVVRLPLDGSGPSAQRVAGAPIDQFSFLEQDGHLNVVVRSEGAGDAMWAPEVTSGDVAMLRMPVSIFSEPVGDVARERYAKLPKPAGYTFQNRFVGEHLLYGTGSSWGHARKTEDAKLFVYRFAGGPNEQARELPLPHAVDRIEAMGKDAVVVGGDGKDLFFTSIALGASPRTAGRYVREGATQGELRSHGFFYKPEAGGDAGVIGLPVRGQGKPGAMHLVEGSASIVFVKNERLDLRPMGELEAGQAVGRNDACRASCVDWYGNARPIFLGRRAFALMGYELVEGSLLDGRVRERRRVSFAPNR